MPFEFTSPQTLDDALKLWHTDARWFAGGTDLVPELKTELAKPTRLVNVKGIADLYGIAETPSGLRIGALMTLTEIAESVMVRERCRAVAESCAFAATPQLRHVATIGGNLAQDSRCQYYRGAFRCWLKGGDVCYMREGENREAAVGGYHDCVHVHPSDPAVALVALDAKIAVRGRNGTREIAAAEFFHTPASGDRRLNNLQPDELITNLQLPNFQNSRSNFLKTMDRAVWAFALVSAAVRLDLDGAKVRAARIVLGGVAPIPWREERAEKVLIGQEPTEELAARAAAQVLQSAEPLAHNAYKLRLARALVKRGILRG
ncbi:MAG: xanthine dehydrogenase family protein subunit M [Chloroflexi bacterium]|nr:xanthine dehydrogenase family protein subunit M [Chloroflexota bacterium]